MLSSTEATRILVVDDQPDMAEMLADDLSNRGYEAVATSSGRDALKKLKSERFDALVTDLRMPEIDGLALLRASHRLDPSRPVIVMTAHGTLDTAVEASGRGAYHYLTKPFRLEELVRLIELALGRS
jgi:two-component system, NtrC family, response regulator HydG